MKRFAILAACLAFLAAVPAGRAYVEAPYTLGRICHESTNIVLVEVTKVNKDKNLIIYKKVQDLKGQHPQQIIKHNIGQNRKHEREWKNVMAWAFIVEFPWFEPDAEGRLTFMHHPFTMPFDDDLRLLDSDPLSVRAKAYDMVANGEEFASGSIRVHRADIQSRLFELLGYSPERIESNFGHMLRAFQFGAPPHGGIAPGLDRVVSVLADEDSIRDVIAFPKNQSVQDLMMGAPTVVQPEQLRDLHIRVEEPEPVS